MIDYASSIAVGYLFGSLPWGLIVGYIWLRRDIRESGSGKTGTTNVLRTAGKIPAALVMILDIAKGTVPALFGRLVLENDGAAVAGACAAVVGHIWPVFAGFRGGRGVASTYGGILGLAPLLSLGFPVVGLLLIVSTRYVSVMSVVGVPVCVGLLAVAAAIGWTEPVFVVFGVFAATLVEYKHIPNIQRLRAGTEPKIGQGGSRQATG